MGGELPREGRVVPGVERIGIFNTERTDDAPARDAAAAASVNHRARARRPAALAKPGEDMVPFPSDALPVGGVVVGKVGGRPPIRSAGGGAATR